MKARLIILSDLWGIQKAAWEEDYVSQLNDHYELKFYDCCSLGKVDKSDYTEEKLHRQFVGFGIENAVLALGELEKAPVHVLAFSVGGVVAWKYALLHGNILSLSAISSTRLRYETLKPTTKIDLYFGEQDHYKPQKIWFEQMNLSTNFVPEQGHSLYKNKEFINRICQNMKCC